MNKDMRLLSEKIKSDSAVSVRDDHLLLQVSKIMQKPQIVKFVEACWIVFARRSSVVVMKVWRRLSVEMKFEILLSSNPCKSTLL